MSSSGSPLPAISQYVRTPLAVTNGIACPLLSSRKNAVAGTEYDPERRTGSKQRLIQILLGADDRTARRKPDHMMDLRTEICRADECAQHDIQSLVDRFVHSHDS